MFRDLGVGEDGDVATPYTRSAPPPQPPRLVRPVHGRILGGVCAGLAEHLGVSVLAVRVVTVLLATTGAGVVGYLFLWALTPEGDDATSGGADRAAHAGATGAPGSQGGGGLPEGWAQAVRFVVGGLALVLLGLAWLAERAGFDARLGIVVPVLLAGLGAVIAFSQLDESQRGAWLGTGPASGWRAATRLGLGVVLASTGLLVLASRGATLPELWDVGLATVAVLAGVLVIVAPWALRVWTDLRREQAARARADERADIAAHLHDSVLQTLALIQRRADDPVVVGRLARAQERELRSWLYARPSPGAESLAAAVTEVAHEVEDLHGVPVELVATGDRPLDPHGRALAQAVREALLNAVRHGRPPVAVYLEVGPAGVEAFVRDHGPGVDLGAVPADRLGIRESILGRMQRHGGTARVRTLEEGTEVELTLPPLPATEGAQA